MGIKNPVRRDELGRIVKGSGSLNPSGGRSKLTADVAWLAREHTMAAIATIYEIMIDSKQPAAARIKAAELILERGYGKVPQVLELNEFEKMPIKDVVGYVVEAAKTLGELSDGHTIIAGDDDTID